MSLGERLAAGLRTAGVSPRQFAPIVGCSFTTLYRIMDDATVDPHSLTALSLERSLTRLEELVGQGHLPFDRDVPYAEGAKTLLRLFSTTT